MPGRSPHAAVEAYIGPLQRAVSCLPGSGKIQILTARIKDFGDEGAWVLNGDDDGLYVPGVGSLSASQRFQLVPTGPIAMAAAVGRFRITTLSYRYKLTVGSEEIRWDWHPGGNSPEQRPHMHLSINPKAHLPCARTVFEDVVESCIALGATPACPDWSDRLDESRNAHTQHRSWVEWPRVAAKEIVEVAHQAQEKLKRSRR